jgi:hypothetical protein
LTYYNLLILLTFFNCNFENKLNAFLLMKKTSVLWVLAGFVAFMSCTNNTEYSSKPFFDPYGNKVGDSLFSDNLIQKIVFTDSTYVIDSVVFSRYDNPAKTVKSVNTFMNGKLVFENIYYYQNGKIAMYKFIDEEKSNYFYERRYSSEGAFLQSSGYVFFQGYIVDTSAIQEEKIRKGESIAYRIFYPNPPDCIAKVFVFDEDTGEKIDVYRKSSFLNFLQTCWQDTERRGFFKTTTLLELFDKHADSTIRKSESIIFDVD